MFEFAFELLPVGSKAECDGVLFEGCLEDIVGVLVFEFEFHNIYDTFCMQAHKK